MRTVLIKAIKLIELSGVNKLHVSILLIIDSGFNFIRLPTKPATRFKVDDTFHTMSMVNDLHLTIL